MMRFVAWTDAAAIPLALVAILLDIFYFEDIVAIRVLVLVGMLYGAAQLYRQRKQKKNDAR